MEASIDTYLSASTRLQARRFLRRTASLILCALCPLAGLAARSDPPRTTFDIRADPDFSRYRQVLRPLAEKYRAGKPNDFCIVGYKVPSESKIAWVIWKQRNELILWEAGESDVAMSRRRLNLKKDVVGSDADVGGSTYLVTKAWVDRVIADCAANGTQLHLKK